MTTIIDAFVLTLGLDASGLKKGATEVDTALKKTKESAVKQMTAVETSGNLAADAIGMIARKALALFAIFTAGKGIKEFIGDVTASDNAMGRLSSRLGVGSDTLSEYGQAIDRMGGNGKAAQASFQSLTNSLIDLQQTGQSGITEWYYRLASAAGVTFDRNKKVEDQFLDISAALAKIKAQNPALANWYGQKLGLDQDTIDFLSKGPKFVQGELAKGKKWAPTPEEIKRTDEFLDKWQSLLNISTSFGRHLLSDIEPGIARVAEKFNKWLDDNKDTINKYIVIPFRLVGAAIETAIDLGKALFSVFESIGNIPWVKALVNMIGSGLSAAGGWIDRQIESLPEGNLIRRGYERFKKAATPDGDAPGGGGDGGGGVGSDGGGKAGKWWTTDRMKYAADYLVKNAGLSQMGAAGLVARWAAIEAKGGPGSINPYSRAAGIAQGLGSRRAGYTGSFEDQLAYAAKELNSSEKRAANALRSAKTASEAARGASIFERAEGWNSSAGTDNFTRSTPAQSVFDQIYGGRVPSAPAAPPTASSPGLSDKVGPRGAMGWDHWSDATKKEWIGEYLKGHFGSSPDVDNWIKAHHVSALTPIPSGGLAGLNAARANVSQSTTTNTSSHEVNVNGPITVHTQATDARGVASGLSDAMKRATYAAQANTGLA